MNTSDVYRPSKYLLCEILKYFFYQVMLFQFLLLLVFSLIPPALLCSVLSQPYSFAQDLMCFHGFKKLFLQQFSPVVRVRAKQTQGPGFGPQHWKKKENDKAWLLCFLFHLCCRLSTDPMLCNFLSSSVLLHAAHSSPSPFLTFTSSFMLIVETSYLEKPVGKFISSNLTALGH